MSMNVTTRAKSVARIFDILAMIVLVFGGLATAFVFLAGLFGNMDGYADNWFQSFFMGIVWAAFIAVYTALTWASITLGTVVAGYIARRTEAPSDFARA